MEVPDPIAVKGILDTGASCTCIDPFVAKKLGLESKGDIPVLTPTTGTIPAVMEQYDVSVMIFRTAQEAPFYVANLAVIEANQLSHGGHQALIGRDILSRCLLTYDGMLGQYSLAF